MTILLYECELCYLVYDLVYSLSKLLGGGGLCPMFTKCMFTKPPMFPYSPNAKDVFVFKSEKSCHVNAESCVMTGV